MKKQIFLIAAFILLLSGCQNQQKAVNTNNNLKNMENNNNVQQQTTEKTVKNDEILPVSQQPQLLTKYSVATIVTNKGEIKVQLYNDESPITVNNFLYLAEQNFYNNSKFHRVIKDFMIQGGDPNSKDNDRSNDGTGGPGYAFVDEFNQHKLVRGSLAMANTARPNTNGSQFFIVTAEQTPWLDGVHTNFGYVISGWETLDAIENSTIGANDYPVEDIIIEKIILQ